MSKTLGINLGSNVTTVYVEGEGIVVREPNAVAIDAYTQEMVATGQEAVNIYNKTPGAIELITNIYQGNVSDYERMSVIINQAIQKTGVRRPEVVFAVHGGHSGTDVAAIVEMLLEAGARDVKYVDLSTACVIGADLPLNDDKEMILCDIGAANTEIGIVKGCVTKLARTIPYGCNKLDQAITAFVKNEYNARITDRQARAIRENIGSLHSSYNVGSYDFTGVDLVTGLPCDLSMNSSQAVEITKPFADYLVANIAAVIKKLPEAVLSNIQKKGLFLAGGGALDGGIKPLLEERLSIPVEICANSSECAVKGIGTVIENRKVFEVLLHTPGDE